MNNERLKKLEEKTFAITNSEFPIGYFLSDIKQNKDPSYNKETAYEDFEKIVDKFYELKDLNKSLKNENRVLNINIDGLFKTNDFLNKRINLLEYKPTLEECIKEWEALGYECYFSNYGKHLVLMKNVKMDKYNGDYIKIISINSITKTYSCYIDESYSFDEITLQEHQLITKTMKALGWM